MLRLSVLLLAVAATAAPDPMRLSLTAPIARWDEALPLGNGLTGGLLWGEGNEIRLSLDRGDLWDLRPHPAFIRPDFTYQTVIDYATAGRTVELNKEYARVSDFPTKLPGARLVLTLDPRYQARAFALDLRQALGTVDLGPAELRCFFSATEPAGLLFVPGPAPRLSLVANQAVQGLGSAAPNEGRDRSSVWLVQEAALGFRYAILAMARPVAGGTLVATVITTSGDDADPLALARRRAAHALDQGFDTAFAAHRRWWTAFWQRSSVQLPDAEVLAHYSLAQYFYGAASRRGAPPMPLQGVWTADEGKLPPWHGDYHHDLNTQLTYWACLDSGHFDECGSFLDLMWSLKPRHERFARDFFGLKKGFVVPGVMALDGAPMGAWLQYTLSPTLGAWVAQSFYRQWRYEMDPRSLATRAYPYCAGVGEALAALLRPDPRTGRLKLPLSSSPEIHNNTQQAWLQPDSNFDQALLRWLFAANAEMAAALGQGGAEHRWRGQLARLDDLAVSDTGELLVAPGEPLTASHRHHSNLMAIHPLGVLTIEGSERDRRVIDASLANVDRLGTSQWAGYSFSWMAAMRARVGRGDEALRFLRQYLESFTVRNGFHVNGEQTRRGLSTMRGRPFTLEGNFAAAQAVDEMLLQSWGGRVRVFPAMPAAWRDASFQTLRAEGGFQVSAERRDGRTTRVTVRATVAGPLRLRDPFDGTAYRGNRPVRKVDGDLLVDLKPGETVELHTGAR